MAIAEPCQIVKAVTCDFSQSLIYRRHMLTKVFRQIQGQQVLQAIVNFKKVQAVAILGKPVFKLALVPFLDVEVHIHDYVSCRCPAIIQITDGLKG